MTRSSTISIRRLHSLIAKDSSFVRRDSFQFLIYKPVSCWLIIIMI
nr:MAG TPA: hypothetical protein [Caudoviricetes sp.]